MIGTFEHSNPSTGKVIKRAYVTTDILKSASSSVSCTIYYLLVKLFFSVEHRCPYCDKAQDRNTEHDHFLQCNSLREEKTRWIDKLRAILFKNFNPPNLHEEILERIYNYYEVILWDSKKSETSNWIISMTLLAIQKRRYRQKDIREELLNQIAIRIPMMNHPYPHPQTTKTKTH